jgi:tetratricopeptide (TPR) repeat protein/tRNA A-37 threonylcarbamoyl transferase component Bud32
MDDQQWNRAQEIFHEVVDQDPLRRAESVSALCHGDFVVRDLVLSMIEEDASKSLLLDNELQDTVYSLLSPGLSSLQAHMFGPYHLVRLLGEGGMGVVYLAERDDLGSQAAIKILRDATLSPMRRQRFAVEQRMLSHLNHPYIARLYDADTLEDGTPYIVMEYCDGIPLTSYAEAHESPIEDILRLMRSICEAVQYAHAQAIIHRDLKPTNILVTDDGVVKLLDFGIGKQLQGEMEQDSRTITALHLLTPAYASPEHIRGGPIGIQADVYSLGVILYELLSGCQPFDFFSKTAAQIEQLIEEGPKPPSAFGKDTDHRFSAVPELSWSELDTICLTAMHNDPARRYRSVEALTRDLDHYLKSEPLEARPDSLGYRARKFLVRNRKALVWATAASLIMIALAIVSILRITKARRETTAQEVRTQQIQRFMLNLFNGGDTQSAPSEDLRVTTLVDRGVQELKMLDQDPETSAQLDQTLAGIYEKLGKFEKADPLLQSALETRRKLYGQDSPQVADTMTDLGVLRLEQANPKEGERLIRAALSIDQRLLPVGDPSTAKAMSALGQVLEESGSYQEAVSLLQQAIKLQSRRSDLVADLSASISKLATADFYLGHYAEADSLDRQALAIDQKIYGQLHPRVADDLINLGEIEHALDHEKETEDLDRRALSLKTSWYGEKHPDTAFCLMVVGQSLIYQKRFEEAHPFVQKSLAIQEEVFGKFHPRVAMALSVAGLLEERLGHFEAAENDFLRMAAIHRSTYGDRHFLVGVAILDLGQAELDQKKYAQAQSDFQGALDRFVEKLPPDHPYAAIARQKLGAVLVLEHKYREAEGPLLAAYQAFSKQTPQPVDRLASTRKDLASVYEHLHQEKEASFYLDSKPSRPS